MFILPADSSKPVCLTCSVSVTLIKSGNVKRHYETRHSAFERSYPPKSELRARKIAELRAQYDKSTRLITPTFTAQQCANECSLSDESTDVSDNAQLLVYVRFFNKDKKELCEDLLGVMSLERDISPFVDFINKLIQNFSKRFNSFCLGQQLLLLIQNPFLIREVREFSKEVTQTFRWANAGSLQLKLIDLQGNAALREHFEAADPATFWLQTVSESVFPGLTKVALQTLTIFGMTYSCESAFSTMNIIKNKYRSRLTNEHLHVCMRMALTPFRPRFKSLAGQPHAHFSH